MSKPASHAARPIIFLNPDVVGAFPTWAPGVRYVETATIVGGQSGGSVSLRNEPMEALRLLVESLGAQVVCTRDGSPYDARDLLLARGLAPCTHPDWRTDQVEPDRAVAIERWWVEHCKPRAMIIDRPEVAVAGIARIAIGTTSRLTDKVAREAIAAMSVAS